VQTLIILSAQYVNAAIRSEVGQIPLSFIPLGNRRLYELQIEGFRKTFSEVRIIVTLPANHTISESDLLYFERYKIELINLDQVNTFRDEILKLSKSLSFNEGDEVCIIFGSYLPIDYSSMYNSLAFSWTNIEPSSPVLEYGYEKDLVWAGIIKTNDWRNLVSSVKVTKDDYWKGLTHHSISNEMSNVILPKCYFTANAAGYWEARSFYTTERSFNSIKVDGIKLRKESENKEKLKMEAAWYLNCPFDMRHFLPQFYFEDESNSLCSYTIEYLAAMPLNEIFVFGHQTVLFWDRIFLKLKEYFKLARSSIPESFSPKYSALKDSLFVTKTRLRVEDFFENNIVDFDSVNFLNGNQLTSFRDILENSSRDLKNIDEELGFIHGDLCLSNILYDSRLDVIKLIDPRGLDADGESMVFGSLLYDFAKLSHSILGLYDYIVAGQFKLVESDNNFEFSIHNSEEKYEMQNLFLSQEFIPSLGYKEILSLTILIFYSILPLHKDDSLRQKAFLANILRLNLLQISENKKCL